MTRSEDFGSPLDVADSAFRALVTGPAPLSVNGRRVPGLPGRRIRLDQLKRLLLRRSTSPATRDAAWTVLVRRARSGDPSWVIGAVGVAMPGLRRAAGKLACGYHGDTCDLDAEILTGFLTALRSVDTDRRRIALRLCWAAYRAGARHRYADAALSDRHAVSVAGTAPPRPWGHPDFVLADAVAAKVISVTDAFLIGRTRLENLPLPEVARDLRLSYKAAEMRRWRAETRLIEAIVNDDVQSRVLPDVP